jgi:myo-inositol catabolism protein IolC
MLWRGVVIMGSYFTVRNHVVERGCAMVRKFIVVKNCVVVKIYVAAVNHVVVKGYIVGRYIFGNLCLDLSFAHGYLDRIEWIDDGRSRGDW